MKWCKMLKKGSIPFKIYQIFLRKPMALSTSYQIHRSFLDWFSPIPRYQFSVALSRLTKQGLITRTPTQTRIGYIYTLRNKKGLNKVYTDYLLPYSFVNRDKLINLMLKSEFPDLSTDNNLDLKLIERNPFIKKYSLKYFYSKTPLSFMASLVAFVMGDGHIRKNMAGLQFFFKHKHDAEIFKEDFLNHFPFETVVLKKSEFCYFIEISSKGLAELLQILGAPSGNKVFQEFNIPNWIFPGPNYIKLAFLSVIYGNEGSKPQDNRWRIQFTLSKNFKYIVNLLNFLNQLRAMIVHFGFTPTFIQLRKQKGRNFCGRFYLKGDENIRKFYNLLEFSYASEKQRVLESLILEGRPSRV